VGERIAISAGAFGEGAPPRLWLNRYGYLSDTKLADLGRMMKPRELAA
jgi:hypothetical protein